MLTVGDHEVLFRGRMVFKTTVISSLYQNEPATACLVVKFSCNLSGRPFQVMVFDDDIHLQVSDQGIMEAFVLKSLSPFHHQASITLPRQTFDTLPITASRQGTLFLLYNVRKELSAILLTQHNLSLSLTPTSFCHINSQPINLRGPIYCGFNTRSNHTLYSPCV